MPARRWDLDRLVGDVASLTNRGLPRERYYDEVTARLRRVVPSDAACWHTLDPGTRLMTSEALHELVSAGFLRPETVPTAGAMLVASEYLIDDVNTFAGLAARRVPVATLSQATAGRPERSARYRNLLAPHGMPHELRAAFVSRGRCWGAVHIGRGEDRPDFSAEDVAALASIAGVVADGLRESLRFDAAQRADGASPGLVVLGPHNDVELITPPARELLAAMRTVADDDEAPPGPLLALAAFTRRGRGAQPVAFPTASGWVTLHASLPEGAGAGRVAIVLERGATSESTAVRLEAHGVTAREREIAGLLARGLTKAEIAAELVLSPYTVQDHVKRLFEKTGVSSRQELVARVFLDDYLPAIAARTPLTSTGRFETQQHETGAAGF